MIPAIVHQIWIGVSVPDRVQAWMDTIIKKSEMSYLLWSREALAREFPNAITDFGLRDVHPAYQADCYRLLILHRYGGVYLDADCSCHSSLSPILSGGGLMITCAGYSTDISATINNHFFASVPRHPLLMSLLQAMRDNPLDMDIQWRLGCKLFGKHIMLHADETCRIIGHATAWKYITHHNMRSFAQ